jgi:hypothetical protein
MLAQRYTTEYIELEDRLRVSAISAEGGVVVVWVTRRLSDRLIAQLCRLFDQPGESMRANTIHDVQQSFAQMAAMSNHAQQVQQQAVVAVKPKEQESAQAWLILEIDIKWTDALVTLICKGSTPQQTLTLNMNTTQLRQWMGIMLGQYARAQWPTGAFPDWFLDAAQSRQPSVQAQTMLH